MRQERHDQRRDGGQDAGYVDSDIEICRAGEELRLEELHLGEPADELPNPAVGLPRLFDSLGVRHLLTPDVPTAVRSPRRRRVIVDHERCDSSLGGYREAEVDVADPPSAYGVVGGRLPLRFKLLVVTYSLMPEPIGVAPLLSTRTRDDAKVPSRILPPKLVSAVL